MDDSRHWIYERLSNSKRGVAWWSWKQPLSIWAQNTSNLDTACNMYLGMYVCMYLGYIVCACMCVPPAGSGFNSGRINFISPSCYCRYITSQNRSFRRHIHYTGLGRDTWLKRTGEMDSEMFRNKESNQTTERQKSDL